MRNGAALDASLTERSRPARVALVIAAAAWELLTFPLVAWDWSWPWVATVFRTSPYQAVQEWSGDSYVVFGALGGLSFLAIGAALLPDLRRAGWGGMLLACAVLAGGVVTALSYLGTPEDSVLHPLWGAEILALALIAIAGPIAAMTSGRSWPAWTRWVMGATVLFLAAGVVALMYYPHGPLVIFAVEAVLLIAGAPRDASPE